jgi:hypothetical protein
MEKQYRISTFKELFDEIVYSWENDYDLIYHKEDDSFTLNKLYITKNEVCYKTDTWYLENGVFDKLKVFYNLLYPPANSIIFIKEINE